MRTASRFPMTNVDFKASEKLYSLWEHNSLTYKEGFARLNKSSPENINKNNNKQPKKK